ncbi:MAG: fbpB, partial [Modestobacter sp.]|nr:fbpB [Modestobacter sp.]
MLVAAVALLPLGYIVGYTVDVGWSGVRELVFRPRVGELLWNSARLVVGTVACCVVLGLGAAWLVERSAVPARRGWHVLLVAPLAVPAFVNSYAWISLLPGLDTYGGALLVVTLSYFPFVYLPVAAAFRGLDPALEETARGLGLGGWAVFLRVQLPQLRVAVLGGGLLVSLHLLAEFGALQMLRFPTFTTAIYDQYRATFNGPGATMLAGVLVLICLVLLLAELRLRGRAAYARSGGGAARP